MYKFITNLLDKMGNWFGIVFKIILPAIIMYRPIRLTAFTFYVYGALISGNVTAFNDLGKISIYVLYIVLLCMLFLAPKSASVFEFVMVPYYLINLIILSTAEYFELNVAGLEEALVPYVRMAPVVILFIAFKVFFYFFIKVNRNKLEEDRLKKFDDKYVD
ncbi:MAG: hypothetical protein IJF19_01235 [Clostridia bacterium]|nr:hypothetical protein [Clostridia bacterium]